MLAVPAHPQGGPPSFTELSGAAGCLLTFQFQDGSEGCSQLGGLAAARSVTVSPDDRFVYVASGGHEQTDFRGRDVLVGSNGVAVFRRDGANGALEPAGCITASGGDGRPGSEGLCQRGDALLGASDVAISADGRRAYVASVGSNGVSYMDRDPATGALAPAGCVKDVRRRDRCTEAPPLVGAAELAVSADGADVYVAASDAGAINALRNDAETGALESVQCVSETGSDGMCEPVAGLTNIRDVVVSPAGGEAYAAGLDGVVAAFACDPATGRLRQTGCLLADAPEGGPCARGAGLGGARDVAISPDGRDVYVAAGLVGGSVTSFRRDADGALRQTGCIQYVAPPEPLDEEDEDSEEDEETEEEGEASQNAQAEEGCSAVTGSVDVFTEIVVSADGGTLFVAGGNQVAMFRRDRGSGELTPAGCAAATFSQDSRCVKLQALDLTVDAIATTSDGRNLYLVSRAGVVRVLGASVAIASASLRARRSGRVAVPLACPAARARPCVGRVALRGTRSHRYRVRPGSRGRVSVRLGARARHRMARRGAIRLTARASDRRGALRPTIRRVTVRRALERGTRARPR